MKMLTKKLETLFEKEFPLYSQDGKGFDAKVIVKYFNPSGAGDWLITEAKKEGNDWLMFGFCHLGHDEFAELGYVSLNELKALKVPPFNLGIERNMYYEPASQTLKEAIREKHWNISIE